MTKSQQVPADTSPKLNYDQVVKIFQATPLSEIEVSHSGPYPAETPQEYTDRIWCWFTGGLAQKKIILWSDYHKWIAVSHA